MKNQYNLICFGFLPWSNMWKRNQSMIAEMAKFDFIDKVLFINPDITIRHLLSLNKNFGMSLFNSFLPKHIKSNIWEYTPVHFYPFKFNLSIPRKLELISHLYRLKTFVRNNPYVLFINNPDLRFQYPLDNLRKSAALTIFDFSDDFIELPASTYKISNWNSNINKYARSADLVLAINDHVKNKYLFLNKNIYVVRNATNYFNFNRNTYNQIKRFDKMKEKGTPIVGYIGSFHEGRINKDLLLYLLENRPNWEFVFIVISKSKFIDNFIKYDNFHLLDPVDYQVLPDYINYFDAAIVPFKINEQTKGNDLLKFHDYLSMGKPVVTTNIGGAEDLKDVVYIAENNNNFIESIENALSNNASDIITLRQKTAMSNSWHLRIKQVEQLIKTNISIQ